MGRLRWQFPPHRSELCGADRIKAGAAGDDITGGAGADVLSAGAGVDTFHFNTAGFGRDLLYYVNAEQDHVDLSGLASSMSDITLRQSGTGTALATTVTINGNTTDAIALRGVSVASIEANAGFFQF